MGRKRAVRSQQKNNPPTKFVVELNKDAIHIFQKVLKTRDPHKIADDIHKILLAEFEWNSEYTAVWRKQKNPEWLVYPVPGVYGK